MLPGKKISGDYKSTIRPTAGSHLEVLQELITASKDLVDYHSYVVVSLMKLKLKKI